MEAPDTEPSVDDHDKIAGASDGEHHLEQAPDLEPLDPDELSVNELQRFTKESQQLVLEQYGHCEVPAGCGGVVLRWVNPGAPVPMGCRVFSAGRCPHWYVDGEKRDTSRTQLAPGPHVLVLELTFEGGAPDGEACMAAVGTALGSYSQRGAAVPTITVGTSADGSWLARTRPPEGAERKASAHALLARFVIGSRRLVQALGLVVLALSQGSQRQGHARA